MKKIIISVSFLWAIGCNSNSPKVQNLPAEPIKIVPFPPKPLHILTDEEDGGGADIRLSITQVIPSDSFILYKVNSTFQQKNIGFELGLPISKGLLSKLILKSDGVISNNFLQTFSNIYKVKIDSTKEFIDKLNIAFIDMNEVAIKEFGADSSIKSPVKEIKAFFESDNPDENAEIYFNINDSEHWIEILEKDESYRKLIIKWLTKK